MGQKTEGYDAKKVEKIAQKISDALVGQDRKYIVAALGAMLLYEIVDVSRDREISIQLADWVTKKLYAGIDASLPEEATRM
jgi:hypothetical protein